MERDYDLLLYDTDAAMLDEYSYILSCRAFCLREASRIKDAEREILRSEFPIFLICLRSFGKREEKLLSLFKSKSGKRLLLVILPEKDPDLILKLIGYHPHDILVEPLTEKTLAEKVGNAFEEITGFSRSGMDAPERLQRRKKEERVPVETIYQAYDELFNRLIVIAEYRDNLTANHIKRVGYYSSLIAMHLGFDEELQDMIFYAAQLHDIGKLVVPDSVLFKKGRLTKRETEIVRNHSALGARLLEGSSSPILKMAEDIAMNHHERWDGSGYPRGLKGEEIPMVARIVAISDVYDSLRTRRPYKKACTHKEACETIMSGDRQTRPEHFDPEVLETFLRLEKSIERIYTESVNTSESREHQDLVMLLRRLFHE